MKKKWVLLVLSLILIGALSVIVILYNTPDIRIGMSRSLDGKVNFPSITCNAYLEIGMSEKAEQKWINALEEFRTVYADEKDYLLTHYTNLELDAVITFNGNKTYIHLFGKGMYEGSTEMEMIDKNYELNFKAKPEKQ